MMLEYITEEPKSSSESWLHWHMQMLLEEFSNKTHKTWQAILSLPWFLRILMKKVLHKYSGVLIIYLQQHDLPPLGLKKKSLQTNSRKFIEAASISSTQTGHLDRPRAALLEPGHSQHGSKVLGLNWGPADTLQPSLWSSEAARRVKFDLIPRHLWTLCSPGPITYYKEELFKILWFLASYQREISGNKIHKIEMPMPHANV